MSKKSSTKSQTLRCTGLFHRGWGISLVIFLANWDYSFYWLEKKLNCFLAHSKLRVESRELILSRRNDWDSNDKMVRGQSIW